MFEKGGRFYADWRDADGTRKRKSFTSKRAALTYEAEQKELAHPKPKAQGARSGKSFARTSATRASSVTATGRASRASSSLRLVRSNRKS